MKTRLPFALSLLAVFASLGCNDEIKIENRSFRQLCEMSGGEFVTNNDSATSSFDYSYRNFCKCSNRQCAEGVVCDADQKCADSNAGTCEVENDIKCENNSSLIGTIYKCQKQNQDENDSIFVWKVEKNCITSCSMYMDLEEKSHSVCGECIDFSQQCFNEYECKNNNDNCNSMLDKITKDTSDAQIDSNYLSPKIQSEFVNIGQYVCRSGKWQQSYTCNACLDNYSCSNCKNEETRCDDGIYRECVNNEWKLMVCPYGCDGNSCSTGYCTNGETQCHEGIYRECVNNEWKLMACPYGCDGNSCSTGNCTNGETMCKDGIYQECINREWKITVCPNNASCIETCSEYELDSEGKPTENCKTLQTTCGDCQTGDTKCGKESNDSGEEIEGTYSCIDGKWSLVESCTCLNHDICADCTGDAERCIDGMSYHCTNNGWAVSVCPNNASCIEICSEYEQDSEGNPTGNCKISQTTCGDCQTGDTKCGKESNDSGEEIEGTYSCIDGKWSLVESCTCLNHDICADCTGDAEKCIDGMSYHCTNNAWSVSVCPNNASCIEICSEYEQDIEGNPTGNCKISQTTCGDCQTGDTKCGNESNDSGEEIEGTYSCIDGKWSLVESCTCLNHDICADCTGDAEKCINGISYHCTNNAWAVSVCPNNASCIEICSEYELDSEGKPTGSCKTLQTTCGDCQTGDTKCGKESNDSGEEIEGTYSCIDGKWSLVESCTCLNHDICADCTGDAEKCINGISYHCTNNAWAVSVCPNNASCLEICSEYELDSEGEPTENCKISQTTCGECQTGDIKCELFEEVGQAVIVKCAGGRWPEKDDLFNADGSIKDVTFEDDGSINENNNKYYSETCATNICNADNAACGCLSSEPSICNGGVLTSCIKGDWVNIACPSGECDSDSNNCKVISLESSDYFYKGCFNKADLPDSYSSYFPGGQIAVVIKCLEEDDCKGTDVIKIWNASHKEFCMTSCNLDGECGECVDGEYCSLIGGICDCNKCDLGKNSKIDNPNGYSCKKDSSDNWVMGECANGFIKCYDDYNVFVCEGGIWDRKQLKKNDVVIQYNQCVELCSDTYNGCLRSDAFTGYNVN